MDLTTFIRQRQPEWRQLEQILDRVEGSGLGTLDDTQAADFGRLYRRAASDLNQAQTFVSGDATVQYLNNLVARCYVVIYSEKRIDWRRLVRYLLWGYPAVFRRHIGAVVLATVIFTAGTIFGAIACHLDPDEAQVYLMPANFPTIRPRQEGEPDKTPAMTSAELATLKSFYFTNNLRVCLVVFALGLTLGIGTSWILFVTGLMTGVLGMVYAQAGQLRSFCAEILPHGVVEIPACLIAGAAGFLLAKAIFQARPWSRVEELARAGKEALLLLSGCVPLIAAAAVLEAGVARAPEWLIGSGVKLAFAGVVGSLFIAYLVLLGWGKSARESGEPS
jgi:uncharacterized membrane protein SpoIIM required for sporulation